MGYNRKSAAIFSSNKQMQPMHSREIFHPKKKNQATTKEGKSFHSAPTKRRICYKTSSGPEAKNNSTRSERQQNTPQRQLCPPLETPVSNEENLR